MEDYDYDCVGPGWRAILERLVIRLKTLGWDGDVVQVKEKFGTLRFYVGAATNEMRDAITEAEDASAEVCEYCAAPGTLRMGGWYKTLCDACDAVAAGAV